LKVSDITCGFKAFRADAAREVFERSTISGWAFDAELLVIANELGLTIREVPIVWEDCRDSRVRPISNAIEALRQLYAIRGRMLSGAYRPDESP
ncbi:MAG: glycosyltransferase family 2 protein, partial [Armatimonadota bacterium]